MNDRRKNISAYERGVWEHPLPVILRYTRLVGFSTVSLAEALTSGIESQTRRGCNGPSASRLFVLSEGDQAVSSRMSPLQPETRETPRPQADQIKYAGIGSCDGPLPIVS